MDPYLWRSWLQNYTLLWTSSAEINGFPLVMLVAINERFVWVGLKKVPICEYFRTRMLTYLWVAPMRHYILGSLRWELFFEYIRPQGGGCGGSIELISNNIWSNPPSNMTYNLRLYLVIMNSCWEGSKHENEKTAKTSLHVAWSPY